MGRFALEQALAEHPELVGLLEHAEEDLRKAIHILRPFAQRAQEGRDRHPPDPDLGFQVTILQQALGEIGFILRAEGDLLH